MDSNARIPTNQHSLTKSTCAGDDEDALPETPPWQQSLVVLRRIAVSVALLLLIACGMLWRFEPWMRPLRWSRWPAGLWLALACASGLGVVVAAACRRGPTRRWVRVAAAAAMVALTLGWAAWCGDRMALDRLCHDKLLEPESGEHLPMAAKLVEWFRSHDCKLPEFFDRFDDRNRDQSPNLSHLLECSRWSLRRAFVARLMPRAEPATVLAAQWNELFPAVVGPDVDLHQRRELMDLLNRIRTRKGVPENSQQAATLWMGLVFLTDPPEFGAWRKPIRDAMLTCANPPDGGTGDCWMRVLDTLLAFDPPSQWGELTAPLAAPPLLLRRAVRERVRGMTCHFDAIVTEVDASEKRSDWYAAFALWLDAGRLLAANPGVTEAGRILAWRRTTMFRWLAEGGLGGMERLDRFSRGDQGVWGNLPRDAVVRMTSDEEAILAAAAFASAARATSAIAAGSDDITARAEAHRSVEHARVLYPYLAESQQAELARRIAPALVSLPIFTCEVGSKTKPRTMHCTRCTRFLADLWPQLPPASRKDFGSNFHALWQTMAPPGILLCLDAWSDASCLSNEQRLLSALALTHKLGGRALFTPAQRDHPPAQLDTMKPLPVPTDDAASTHAVAQRLAAAKAEMNAATSAGTTNDDNAWQLMRSNGEGDDLPEWMRVPLLIVVRERRDVPAAETLAGMDLCLDGLCQVDDELNDYLTKRAREGRYVGHPHPDLPDPWLEVFASPAQARTTVLGCLDDKRYLLPHLLTSAVSSPPPEPFVRAVWDALRDTTRNARDERKLVAFGALFRLSPLVTREDRLAMRDDFLRFFEACPIPTNEWPTEAMEPPEMPGSLRPGDAIPWDEDRLAAALAWSSAIKQETDPIRPAGAAEPSTGVFSFLAQTYCSYVEFIPGSRPRSSAINFPTSLSKWKRQPLQLPLEPTPWQRARALHREHPELPWPERMRFRPHLNWQDRTEEP